MVGHPTTHLLDDLMLYKCISVVIEGQLERVLENVRGEVRAERVESLRDQRPGGPARSHRRRHRSDDAADECRRHHAAASSHEQQ